MIKKLIRIRQRRIFFNSKNSKQCKMCLSEMLYNKNSKTYICSNENCLYEEQLDGTPVFKQNKSENKYSFTYYEPAEYEDDLLFKDKEFFNF